MYFKVLKSKTSSHGYTCSLGCSGSKICAFCTMNTYLGYRVRSAKVTAGDPLFISGQKVVSAKMVNGYIKSSVKALGWDPSGYSAHSVRAGAATTAALKGFKDWELKKLGGWSSTAYMGYIREYTKHTVKFPRRLARGTHVNGPPLVGR